MNPLMIKPRPRSCDTFVVVGIEGQQTVFGKNSDRPTEETHEVVRFGRQKHPAGAQLRCQYITIPQVAETYSIILSRPSWLWGAEMGANEWGLCAGNEAVCSQLAPECDDGHARLLGMDIVRLVLERARTAREAVAVAAALLEAHGQGGGCSDTNPAWCYENGFLFADAGEGWVLETAGARWWAAERVPPGAARHISNGLSIRRPDMAHAGLAAEVARRGWWRPPAADAAGADAAVGVLSESFDWKTVMQGDLQAVAAADLAPGRREAAGAEWLRRLAGPGRAFGFREMAAVLRDSESGICMSEDGFETTGSQISILPPLPPAAAAAEAAAAAAAAAAAVHFFTTGSDPGLACYKPFAFPAGGGGGDAAAAGDGGGGGAAETRRLWACYRRLAAGGAEGRARQEAVRPRLRELEEELLLAAAPAAPAGGGPAAAASPELFDHAVRRELAIMEA